MMLRDRYHQVDRMFFVALEAVWRRFLSDSPWLALLLQDQPFFLIFRPYAEIAYPFRLPGLKAFLSSSPSMTMA